MFLLKQLNPICTLVLILTAFCLNNCSESSEFGSASDYEKGGYSPSSGSDSPSGSGTIRGTVRYDNNTAAENVSVSFAYLEQLWITLLPTLAEITARITSTWVHIQLASQRAISMMLIYQLLLKQITSQLLQI